MVSFWTLDETLIEICRGTLQLGVSLLLQSTLLLSLGLLAGRSLARHRPDLRALFYRATLAAVLVDGLLAVVAAGWFRPLWSVSLPSTREAPASYARRPTAPGGMPGDTLPAWTPATAPSPSSAAAPALPAEPFEGGRHSTPWAALWRRGAHPNPFEAYLAQSHLESTPPRPWNGPALLYVGLVGVWSAGAAALLIWLSLCHVLLIRLRRRSVPVTTSDAIVLLQELCETVGVRTPELRIHPRGHSLSLVGLRRPVIFLPATYRSDFSGPELRAVLAHELIHLARGDCAWNLVARLACAIGWVQPLLWVLRRQMEEASEEICDQAVVARHCPPRLYARCLLRLAERLVSSTPERAIGAGIAPYRSSLGQRVCRVLDPTMSRTPEILRRHRAIVALTTATVMALSLAAVAAPSPTVRRIRDEREAARALFRDDARLEAPVTVAERNQPLGEILTRLTRALGTPLTASGDTADDNVTLFMDRRPAAEVFADLAGQFGFRWHRDGEGYLLVQDLAGKQREAALREQELRDQLATIHARMEEEAQKLSVPRVPLLGRLREITARLAHPYTAPRDRERDMSERTALLQALEPRRIPAVAIYRSLGPEQIRQLIEGRELWLSAADGTLSPEIARRVAQAQQEEQQITPDPFVRLMQGSRIRICRPEEAEARVQLLDLRVGDEYADEIGPPGPDQNRLRLEITLPAGPEGHRWASRLLWSVDSRRPEGKLPAVVTRTRDPELTRAVQLTFPKPDWQRTAVDGKAFAEAYSASVFGAWPDDVRTIGEIAAALHRATGLQIVADSFVRARVPADLAAGSRPVVEILDAVANALDYTWRKEGDVIFLRNRRYARDRPEAIPERLLHPWRERVGRQGAATLDDLAALAASLTEPQARGAQQYWGWYFAGLPTLPPNRGAGGFYGSRWHLRFWGSLTPRQRQAALSGQVLPVTELTLSQRQAFADALRSDDLQHGTEYLPDESGREPTPAEVAQGAFHIEAGSFAPVGSLLQTVIYTLHYYRPGELSPSRTFEMQIIAPRRRP